jgi:hypothetical protein
MPGKKTHPGTAKMVMQTLFSTIAIGLLQQRRELGLDSEYIAKKWVFRASVQGEMGSVDRELLREGFRG